jgi:hypothetical protein
MHSALRKSGQATAVSIAALLAGNPAFASEAPSALYTPSQLLNFENGPPPDAINALNIDQVATTGQTVLNLAHAATASVDQSGVNMLNVVDLADATLNVVTQTVRASQGITNELTAERVVNSSQEARNVANSVRAAEVGTVDQVFERGSEQIAENLVNVRAGVDNLTQTASNLLNVVEVTGVAEVIGQSFPSGTEQVARNVIAPPNGVDGGEMPGAVRNVVQDAVNIVNFIKAADVGTIRREAAGDQLAENLITTNANFESISQSALNVVNYAQVDNVGILDQSATGIQTTINRVDISGGATGSLQEIQQVFLNSANMVDATGSIGTIVNQTNAVATRIVNEINDVGNANATNLAIVQSSTPVGNLAIIDETLDAAR